MKLPFLWPIKRITSISYSSFSLNLKLKTIQLDDNITTISDSLEPFLPAKEDNLT